MRYLISIDVPEASAQGALNTLTSSGKVARVARVRNGVANIDFLNSKGDTIVTVPTGAKFNSARKYKFNDKTFKAKGLKAQPCVTWA
jgi:hypothetical protein